MYRLFLCFSVHLLLATLAYTQNEVIAPIGFNSERESNLLKDPNAKMLDILLMTRNPSSDFSSKDISDQIATFAQELIEKGIFKLSDAKLVKFLHREIHDRFLKKYELVSPFYQIFESGTYNCVSATALCALVMDQLRIPYSIQELPNHAYLIAWPETRNIIVEMTSLNDGYYVPSRREMTRALNSLRDNKLISDADYLGKDEVEIYNLVFFDKKSITLRELAGLQYFNEAIVMLDQNKLKFALDEILKSELLVDNNRVRVFKATVLTEILQNSDFTDLTEFRYLLVYANQPNAEMARVKYDYAVLLENELNQGRKKFADSTFAIIQTDCTDSLVRMQLSTIYYIQMSYYYSSSLNLEKAMQYLEQGVSEDDKDPFLLKLYTECLVKSLVKKLEYEELLAEMEVEKVKHPFLQEQVRFQVLQFYTCYELSIDYYYDDEEAEGERYFKEALAIRDKMEDNELINENVLGWLFAEKAAFLYRKQEYKKALEVLNEGLVLSPQHERILARIDIVKDKLAGRETDDEEEMEDYEPIYMEEEDY